ncbi:xanthine dehydrogenase family protein molybdopterin-binding subunit [Salipiger marinus]|uniref:xanthine dehydrogenase family protein molybdopterin-binding subunit n=1 Tax=Salipiger marinus TaxID=555512 RepID=UPI002BC421D8|nr:xanthine dehydrogenase family protein molybdopterin-binding subunit [Salipiger manganoxidans]MEB3419165.1 xanthine dehydrogenase family protein molybdopterin-binding subunit [Salipiger manganoxidans]
MTEQTPPRRYVSTNRRVREDRRFVAGRGHYVADIDRPGMLHVAFVASPHPAARIVGIDSDAALALPGVWDVVTGDDISRATLPLMNGLETPAVRRFPLAVGEVRYAGEWVCAVVAESRALAEDAAERVRVQYDRRAFVLDAEKALLPDAPPVHPDHGSNLLLDKTFTWGAVDEAFAEAEDQISLRVIWGRNSTVPIETFGVVAEWDPWGGVMDIWASIQMPKYADQIARALGLTGNAVRVHYDVDVGGSYGVKRGIKHTVLAAHIARKLGRPVRLIEDRLENMRAGDAHGPERIFDIDVAFNRDGIIKSMQMRALDNAGAYAGRAPFQLGKPIGAIVGPYRIGSVRYRAMSVTTNKTVQEAVRGFGQSPTNYAIETMMDRVAEHLGMDRLELRRRNLIEAHEFPYEIPSGTKYDSGDYHTVIDKVLAHADYEALVAERDRLRATGLCAGIGIAACLEPSGGNSSFEPLLNEKNRTSTWMEAVRINVDATGAITVAIHTTSAGQGHETLVSTVVGEALEVDPDLIRVVRPGSLESLPGNSPVGSRMAIMMGGAAVKAAETLKAQAIAIAAHRSGLAAADLRWSDAAVHGPEGVVLSWAELVDITHRRFHDLPEGMSPGFAAQHILQVPTGTELPKDGRVQMYPCFSFEFHLVLVVFDPVLAKPEIRRYVIGHDCGTVINPHIVRGMTLGGIAHGIGAALLEEFAYDADGQLMTQSFLDYLMPSSHEMPTVEIVHHCTPSPHTVFGQKGSGESGYLGAPAAVSGAINDAVAPWGITLSKLPIRASAISDALAAAEETRQQGKTE